MAPLFQEVILAADMRCAKCQAKVANVISRADIDVEAIEVNVSKKEVILTCTPVNEGSSSRESSTVCNNLPRKAPPTVWFPSYNRSQISVIYKL
ncbi:uncharacterized protein LOC123203888 isoform X2 [Mangifera indica]|uniref:uncharacterized protein LOC123203888 isoform X2 n=1 Tax=Mangifera indica TaxID=29780 RepID=UPI001CFBD8FF|nr:uncharacterized protein LOC123203888 isoform X2 [Mangifera indica]